MDGFRYLCALVVAALFVRAAAAKLARPQQTAEGFRALGLSAPGVLAWAVPSVELVVAALLVGAPKVGAAAAILLLGAFTAVLARAVRAGVTTGCTCFGSVSKDPVSVTDLIRNGLMIGLAGPALGAQDPAAPSPLAVAGVVVAVAVGGALLRALRKAQSG